jgi:nucleoside-diphosphate-sugar epimerase
MMNVAFATFLVALALVGLPSSLAFAPTHARSRVISSLYMSSSALIVQNKGGGHGELGYQLAKNLSTNPKIGSITILQDSACKMSKEPFVSYSSDLPNVKIIMADLANESMIAEDMSSLLDGTAYDYVWDNCSKGDVGAAKAVIDCAKAWKSKLLVYVSSAGIYKPNGVVSDLFAFCQNN